jgi:hypothetical protein
MAQGGNAQRALINSPILEEDQRIIAQCGDA